MDFADPPRKPKPEAIVPMINVVFLLLIFFLMTSQVAPPEPFDIETPTAMEDQEPVADPVLYLDLSGRLHFDGAEGDAALDRLSRVRSDNDVLMIKADARLEAAQLAGTLARLTRMGFVSVELVVAPQ